MCNCGRLLTPLLALCLVLASGCGSRDGRVAVRGTVTLNGQPVEEGSIAFLPLDPEDDKHIRAGGTIQEGKYALPANRGPTPGKFRVEIHWTKRTGKQVPIKGDTPFTTDERVEVIPPKYNTNSDLTVDIYAGSEPLDFNLKTE